MARRTPGMVRRTCAAAFKSSGRLYCTSCVREPGRSVTSRPGIGRLLVKRPLQLAQDSPKSRQLDQHGKEPHDGQIAHVVQQLAAGGFHPGPAEADSAQIGTLSQLTDEIGAVEIAAWFAHGEK